MATKTVLPAINKAAACCKFTQGMTFHSDRGVKDACKAMVNTLKSYGSRKGYCRANAMVESFFKSLKTELIDTQNRMSKEQTKIVVFEYIQIWYRKDRRHSYLD